MDTQQEIMKAFFELLDSVTKEILSDHSNFLYNPIDEIFEIKLRQMLPYLIIFHSSPVGMLCKCFNDSGNLLSREFPGIVAALKTDMNDWLPSLIDELTKGVNEPILVLYVARITLSDDRQKLNTKLSSDVFAGPAVLELTDLRGKYLLEAVNSILIETTESLSSLLH